LAVPHPKTIVEERPVLAPGEQDEQVWIMFGDAPGNKLSLPVVEAMLRMWHQRDPEHMGAYVAEAIVGAKPRISSRRHPAQ
jgi:hypothetical protein